MASNQTSNQRRPSGGQQGGQTSGQSGSDPQHDVASGSSSMREYAQQAREYAQQASQYWEQGEDQMRKMVRNREGTALLVAVATGLGIGLVIGATLGRSHREEQTWRNRLNMEGFGRGLMDRIETMIPEAIAEHFGR